MNKVLLIGRLTHDIELRYIQGAEPLATTKFNIAVKRNYKKKGEAEQEADFITCESYGKTAEIMANHIKKGDLIAIEGVWKTGNYTDKKGNKVYTNVCLINRVEFLSKAENREPERNPGAKPFPEGKFLTREQERGFTECNPLEYDELPFK